MSEEVERKGTPPPPYTPQRAPPPYALQNTLNETKETKGRIAPTPFTPFSSTSSSSSIHPCPSSPRPAVIPTGEGINPSSSSSIVPNVASYVVKRAETTEPHEEFCPKCQCRIRTRQNFVVGKLTWLLVVIILVVFFPLAFLPFLIESCKDVQHYCPKCSMLLSVKKRLPF